MGVSNIELDSMKEHSFPNRRISSGEAKKGFKNSSLHSKHVWENLLILFYPIAINIEIDHTGATWSKIVQHFVVAYTSFMNKENKVYFYSEKMN